MTDQATNRPACLILSDGTVFSGFGVGCTESTIGELCFNTAMTGYEEILTDPSYAGQIITFTFPHIGNVGCNDEDIESKEPHCAGLVLRERPTVPSSFRSKIGLDEWLKKNNIAGIIGVDTRALTRHIRKNGAQNAMILHGESSSTQIADALAELKAFPSMKGLELAADVTTKKTYEWKEPLWQLSPSTEYRVPSTAFHVVAMDFGIKHNILRNLAEVGCRVTVVPAKTSAKEILGLAPDGIFLSNGPGDPEATALYALPVIRELIDSGLPVFGICLGHQLLGLALGAKTEKMRQGHRGANHPVKELATNRVMITSQNHGFAVSDKDLPADLEITHISLFDGTVQGIRHKTRPIFGLQGHPEASPGPHDTFDMFGKFVEMLGKSKQRAA
ncbi:MAG: glutamine-hydrolyzing carbamoyl-phosphate synthase small subunit [Alphaproteobacteria bacterium]|nr:glutamine-hydrolyzing carbamoyl-phosphate synthase small subunit [Alphaproteobacteria bacterium]